MARLILITGGARSGKSSFALSLAESLSPNRLFVATCPTIDPEMAARVRRHREERQGRGWTTIERPTDLAGLFADEAAPFEVVLIDCLTLWVNNLLYADSDGTLDDSRIGELCRHWLQEAKKHAGTVICVTNEVGLGIVPDNPLARRYRDLVGTCNQLIGRMADEAVLVSCGIPLYLKRSLHSPTPDRKNDYEPFGKNTGENIPAGHRQPRGGERSSG
jgi:adenosylcobinamide kinase/adenosylcobinamide-phosphate guanylyltransferase